MKMGQLVGEFNWLSYLLCQNKCHEKILISYFYYSFLNSSCPQQKYYFYATEMFCVFFNCISLLPSTIQSNGGVEFSFSTRPFLKFKCDSKIFGQIVSDISNFVWKNDAVLLHTESRNVVMLFNNPKGQIILKTNFLVLIWTKNPTKLYFEFRPSLYSKKRSYKKIKAHKSMIRGYLT